MHLIPVLIILATLVWSILTYYPPLGAKTSSEQMQTRAKQSIYQNGQFQNQIETKMDMSFGTSISLLKEWIFATNHRKPPRALPMVTVQPNEIRPSNEISYVWIGHSSLLIHWRGKTILVDPMFSNAPSPFPWLGGQRFSKGLPFEIENVPRIDAVIYSHDHYDHLDYATLIKIKDKVDQFFVPLGVDGHLKRWGVEQDKIKSFDWWDEFEWNDLKIISAPARHFSGRSLTDRNATLWCSWILMDANTRVYLSGDSGYGPHFREIGERFGPFDFAWMESGQYNPAWQSIHMLPEETVQATVDIKTTVMMPIHWGAFVLSLHDWDDPVRKVHQFAEQQGIQVISPKIGERVVLGEPRQAPDAWWNDVK